MITIKVRIEKLSNQSDTKFPKRIIEKIEGNCNCGYVMSLIAKHQVIVLKNILSINDILFKYCSNCGEKINFEVME